MTIGTKISVFSTAAVSLLGVGIVAIWLSANEKLKHKQEELVTSQAVEIGKSTAAQIAATRSIYAEHIVGGLKPHGVKFSQQPKEGEAPLPAVFMGHVSNKLSEGKEEGEAVSYALRSGWNINPEQGIETEFEKKGWENLLAQESAFKAGGDGEVTEYQPYWERLQLEGGHSVIRVMTADVASAASCVSCHNNLEQKAEIRSMRANSDLKTFELGDLMGAVVTTVPLAQSEAIAVELATTQSLVSRWIIGSVFLGVLFASGTGVVVGKKISQRLLRVTKRLENLSEGDVDLTARLDTRGADEVDELCEYFNRFAGRMENLVVDVSTGAASISSSSTDMLGLAEELSTGSNNATQQSASVTSSAEEMSISMASLSSSTGAMDDNIKIIANSVEEMTSTIAEIAENAELSTSVVREATVLASSSNDRISELGTAADEIGKVIQVIQDIAEQTNLLALNATIEAARAGESGKGFAVVASEVKELATQTASATEDIRTRIEAIQGSTESAVDSIGSINEVIGRVNKTAQTISAAVEEQSIATKQIAHRLEQASETTESVALAVQETAAASKEITAAITEVDSVLKQTASGAIATKQNTEQVAEQARQVQEVMDPFKTGGQQL